MILLSAVHSLAVPIGAVTANLDQPAHYFSWGPVQISVGNLVMIGIGLLLFVLALVIPFPKGRKRP